MKIVEEKTLLYDEIAIGQVFKCPVTKNYYMKTNQENRFGNYFAINITDGMYCGRMVQFAFDNEVIPVNATLHIS